MANLLSHAAGLGADRFLAAAEAARGSWAVHQSEIRAALKADVIAPAIAAANITIAGSST